MNIRNSYSMLLALKKIELRLTEIERQLQNDKPAPAVVPENILFSLPDHLRKTYLIVAQRGESNANDVSALSTRSRPIESNYLNQLAFSGWLRKKRKSKTTYFSIIQDLGNIQS